MLTMNDWQKLIEEYKFHNETLQEMLKEKNKEIRHYREALKFYAENSPIGGVACDALEDDEE